MQERLKEALEDHNDKEVAEKLKNFHFARDPMSGAPDISSDLSCKSLPASLL